jgi:pimeloyl-ACP methyl ester carboxylesterase
LRPALLILVVALLVPAASLARPAAAGHAKVTTHVKSTKKGKKGKKHKKSKKGKTHKPATTPATSPTPSVRSIPVTFTVQNVNKSMVPCATDNHQYTISGTLFLPPSTTPSGVTLYTQGLGFGEYFWDFTAVPGYDYAATMAQLGHASVAIDRLGYGKSSIPPGAASCVGGQATILHEVVEDLRHGSYRTGGSASPISFSKIGLAGHSAGGELVQIEAYSFKDIDALAVIDWADRSYSPGALAAFGQAGAQCVTGGTSQVGGHSSGYGSYGPSQADYDALMFDNIDPAVEQAANAMRSNDPCGDFLSILNAVPIDVLSLGTIHVPVAYVWGTQDANYIIGTPWWSLQELLYTGSPKVTDITLENSGHAVTLQRTGGIFAAQMQAWLTANGL